jgi:rhodanese-related sulfurtransferase
MSTKNANFLSFLFVPFFLLIATISATGQVHHKAPLCLDEKYENKVDSYLSYSVPVLGVEQLKENQASFLILDARPEEEYNVSHIANAERIGFKNLNMDVLDTVPKDTKIVVYCSIGYRSEKVGEKLKKKGFTQVYNLYGSVFEWANRDYPLVDNAGYPTSRVHTYNKKWSKWLKNERYTKVY